jgi:hypothetical protein
VPEDKAELPVPSCIVELKNGTDVGDADDVDRAREPAAGPLRGFFASPRFSVTRSGVAGSMLKNSRSTRPPSASRLTRMFSFASVTLFMPTVGL